MGLLSLAAGSWWYEIWISLWLLICQGIYIFIGALYQVFEKVASVNLFSMDVFTEITGRIYVVMGIAMLFIFAYNLILMIINPDEKKGSNNQMTKVVKETIISLVLLVLLPVIFNYLYVFQSHVLESNIIGQVILGDVGTTQGDYSKCAQDDYECKCDFTDFEELEQYNNKIKVLFGLISWDYDTNKVTQLTNACKNYRENLTPSQRGAYSVAPTVLSAFYRPTNFTYNDCEEYLETGSSSLITTDEDKQICVNFYYDVNYSKYTGNVAAFSNDTYLKDIISDPSKETMEFHWLMATIAGVLAVYMFFCYAMEIGVRVAKLGFLQLISPVPVMMRIIPGQKEKMFDKWLKQLTNTYLDVFIRLLIIYFCLFGISLVPDVIDTMWASTWSGDGNFFVKMLAMVFVILGILKFAGDAPALFKEFFGSSGQFALRSPGKQLQENKIAKGVFSGAGALGAVTAKNIKDIPSAINNIRNAEGGKEKWKAFSSSALNPTRVFGQQIGAARNGYKYGREANNWDDMRKYTYGAAAEQMSKATMGERIKGLYSSEAEAFKNFYTANYEAFDSPAELAKAAKLDKIADALKKLEDKLDGSVQVKAANNAVESIRDHIKKGENFSFTHDGTTYTQADTATAEGMQRVLESLEKYQKERVGIARQSAYKEAVQKSDVEILALAQEYKMKYLIILKQLMNLFKRMEDLLIKLQMLKCYLVKLIYLEMVEYHGKILEKLELQLVNLHKILKLELQSNKRLIKEKVIRRNKKWGIINI